VINPFRLPQSQRKTVDHDQAATETGSKLKSRFLLISEVYCIDNGTGVLRPFEVELLPLPGGVMLVFEQRAGFSSVDRIRRVYALS
jgi:hypothetical protein